MKIIINLSGRIASILDCEAEQHDGNKLARLENHFGWIVEIEQRDVRHAKRHHKHEAHEQIEPLRRRRAPIGRLSKFGIGLRQLVRLRAPAVPRRVERSADGKRDELHQRDKEREAEARLGKEPLLHVAVEQVEAERAASANHKAARVRKRVKRHAKQRNRF